MKFKNFLLCVNGATAIEYALIVAGIGLAIMAVVFAFGEDVAALFDDLVDVLQG